MTAPERVFRPRALLAVCVGLAAAFVGGTVFLLVALRDSDFDRSAVLVVAAIALVVTVLLGRVRAVATASGLQVRNPLHTRTLAWEEVVAVRFGAGDPWVQLDLTDGTSCPVMAIQASDGARGRRDGAWLRGRVLEHEAREP